MVVQQYGQCRWAGEYQHVLFVYRSLEVKTYLVKANLHPGERRPQRVVLSFVHRRVPLRPGRLEKAAVVEEDGHARR